MARRTSKRATVRDVAKLVGVSAITVSRALREPDKVSEDTRQRIAGAIKRLSYVPSRLAGGLSSGRSGVIAVVVPTVANIVFHEIVQAMSAVLSEHRYQILLSFSGYSADEERSLVSTFLGWSPDGIVLSGVHHRTATRKALRASEIPVVETFDLTDDPIGVNIGVSHFRMGYELTMHLWARGFRRIGFVGAMLESDLRAKERQKGYMTAAGKLGIPHGLTMSIAPQASLRAGAAGLVGLLTADPAIDAVIFTSDMLAVGAIMECDRRGWAVPGRVAIAGIGDYEIATQISPLLTTVRLPLQTIGEQAARALLSWIGGDRPRRSSVDLGFEIIQREST